MKRVMLPAIPSHNRKRYALQQAAASSTTNSTSTVEGKPIGENEDFIPMDSVSAFEAIVHQVSTTSGFPLAIPGCFLHQIHVIIKDRTIVNQELQQARTKGELRQLHVEACGILLVRERDYRRLLGDLLRAARQDPTSIKEAQVLERFVEKVLPSWTDLAISQKKLLELMQMQGEERAVTLTLLRLGFIVFQTHGPNVEFDSSFWFTLPNMRSLIIEIEAGRGEFVSMIQRAKPHREVFRSKLMAKKKFKGSSISMDFHIKDAVGAGIVVARDTGLEGKGSLFLLPDRLTD